MRYSQKQLLNKHLVLLRQLNVGEHFKVLAQLEDNFNDDMEEMQGKWATVVDTSHRKTTDTEYFNDTFVSQSKKIIDYTIEDEHNWDNGDHWYEYHMDILATNEYILSKEPQFTGVRPNPKLPSI